MKIRVFATALWLLSTVVNGLNINLAGRPLNLIQSYKRAPLQDLVTWDQHSLFVRGERILFYSGEFHPFRLPVPGLWLDIFQKIRALGYTGVSFYVNWALAEGERGVFRADGIYDLEPFFAAATEAGIYLLARPGPYINAEVSGGGFPGWLQRIPGQVRAPDPSYLNATQLYVESISKIVAKAQITNGGPIILLQSENEYSRGNGEIPFPNHPYFADVEKQYRNGGIVLPFISNDQYPYGYFAPGTGRGAVDIYGFDSYPLLFDCSHPYTWPDGYLPTYFGDLHVQQSPSTPVSIVEFQGGSFDPWGGTGFTNCAILLNHEFERVFYKNDFSFGVTIINYYMTFGGSNWGNVGHPGGYSSYDYGAVIDESRMITREKYSEAKLEANFLIASPTYLTATPGNNSHANGSYTNSDALAVTPLFGTGSSTIFFVLRHSNYSSLSTTNYKLQIPIKGKTINIPQLSGELTLNGRDSKIHVSNYAIGEYNLLYSTAEIFTWKNSSTRTVLVLYGGPNERHELAISGSPSHQLIEGSAVQFENKNGATIANWQVEPTRRVVQFGPDLFVYLLDRNTAYNFWVLQDSSKSASNFTSQDGITSSFVIQAGYLLRTATLHGDTLAITGDLNQTMPIEIVVGAPSTLHTLTFNGSPLKFTRNKKTGAITSTLSYSKPQYNLPDLTRLKWKYHDSLPEIQPDYDDTLWTSCDLKHTFNSEFNLSTPTSLYSADYGYNTGSFIYRGHFTANGAEKLFKITTQGGTAYGASVWLNKTFLGSWAGNSVDTNYNSTFKLPGLTEGAPYVFTVVVDHMGYNENQFGGDAGYSGFKSPRGITNYSLVGRAQSEVTWKMTGNLHGEQYEDKTRGPLNEGGMYAERQGWHLPNPPSSSWISSSPTTGIKAAGIGFYSASFELNMPPGFDIPLSFAFTNSTANGKPAQYRVQLFVNGYQFGEYVNNIGPQTLFPVPQGILNYQGTNWVALTLWCLEAGGARLSKLELRAIGEVQSAYGPVTNSPMPAYARRAGAY